MTDRQLTTALNDIYAEFVVPAIRQEVENLLGQKREEFLALIGKHIKTAQTLAQAKKLEERIDILVNE